MELSDDDTKSGQAYMLTRSRGALARELVPPKSSYDGSRCRLGCIQNLASSDVILVARDVIEALNLSIIEGRRRWHATEA
ncbi:hypothetical protein M378DRAFT_169682 [Amanita muscaria Koide BX008]|uniref:Uncharacterized protein n=1 Tax=Amanita muscaria (strain Koide BX008) TaxID=946122 RepID=A0A0C2WS64_AMAMK|nr:hypothetical protein M378DRAFT_169682 [Amanita muscaria Koide BX008]